MPEEKENCYKMMDRFEEGGTSKKRDTTAVIRRLSSIG